MKKLSKAQQEVMNEAYKDIDRARALTYPEWFRETYHCFQESKVDGLIEKEHLKKYWENERNGIVLTHCNSRTIRKLAELGLVEIVRDSSGESFGIDTIKILNY